MNNKVVVVLLVLIFMPLLLSINTNASTLRVVIHGPCEAQVWVNCPDDTFFVTYSSTTLNFNGSIQVEISPANPGYYVIANGTKVFYPNTFTITTSKSETLYIDVKPYYVRLNFNFEDPGCLEAVLYNGSSIKIYHSTSILVPKDSVVVISSVEYFVINGTTEVSYFPYTCFPTSNITLDVKFINQNLFSSPPAEQNNLPSFSLNFSFIKQLIPPFKFTSQDFLGIGISLIWFSSYLFFRNSFRRRRSN